MTRFSRRAPKVLQWGLLIVLTTVLVAGLKLGQAPAALLLGPLAAGIVFGLRGVEIRPAPLVFAGAQALVGCMIAMAMTPALIAGLAAHGVVYLLLACSTLAITTLFGWVMTARGWLPGTTAIWGMAPGASTAMVLMSDAFGGDRRQVAMIQYLRILMVAGVAIGLAHLAGGGARHPASAHWFSQIDARRVLITLMLAGGLGWIGRVSRLSAGVFLVPMLAGAALQASGLVKLELPALVLAAAYAVIGWNIGLGFTPAALAYSARTMPLILGALTALLVCCGLTAVVVSAVTGVDLLSAYLATSPGGTDSILIIAASTHVDLPFILGAQLVRFLLVLAAGPFLARAVSKRFHEAEAI